MLKFEEKKQQQQKLLKLEKYIYGLTPILTLSSLLVCYEGSHEILDTNYT